MRQFKGREHSPLVQFIKYGIAGVIATLVHICLFQFCAYFLFPALTEKDALIRILHLQVPPLEVAVRARHAVIDNVIGFMIANMVAYLINIAWVFESGRHNRWVEIGFFYLVSGISVLIGSALMGVMIDRYHLSTDYAFGANILVSLMINFVLRKFVIFKK